MLGDSGKSRPANVSTRQEARQRGPEAMDCLGGLIRWASQAVSACEACGMGCIPDHSSNVQLAHCGGNMLLMQLARLPSEVAEIIAYQAVFPSASEPDTGCNS